MKNWKYKDGYMQEIYMKPYMDNYAHNKALKGPANCEGFAVYRGKSLFGLFEFYIHDDIEIGLAINPKYVGKGYAKTYIEQGIEFGVDYFNYKKKYVKLAVEIDNIPALRAYQKTGFVEISRNEEEIMMKYNL